MPCIVDISPHEEINHFQVLLCRACKYLSPYQIETLSNPGAGIYDGLMWYSQHLMFDYHKRCHNNDVLDFDFETSEEEKKQIIQELNRIGYDLIIMEGSTELISMDYK